MATLSIRNLNVTVVQALKLRAKANNRSLEGEARALLERYSRLPTAPELIARADDIAALTPSGRPQSDGARLLGEAHTQ